MKQQHSIGIPVDALDDVGNRLDVGGHRPRGTVGADAKTAGGDLRGRGRSTSRTTCALAPAVTTTPAVSMASASSRCSVSRVFRIGSTAHALMVTGEKGAAFSHSA